ncbi:MAG: hypothetical protein ABIQ95_11115, partial [Bdellovibrionia bacterium]
GADNSSNLNEPSNIHEKMCFEALQFAKTEKNLEVNLNNTFYCGTYRQFINLFASKKYTVKEGLRQIQYSPFLIHGTAKSNFKHILDSIEIDGQSTQAIFSRSIVDTKIKHATVSSTSNNDVRKGGGNYVYTRFLSPTQYIGSGSQVGTNQGSISFFIHPEILARSSFFVNSLDGKGLLPLNQQVKDTEVRLARITADTHGVLGFSKASLKFPYPNKNNETLIYGAIDLKYVGLILFDVDCENQSQLDLQKFLDGKAKTFIKEKKLEEKGLYRTKFIKAFGKRPEEIIRAACQTSKVHPSRLYQFAQFVLPIESKSKTSILPELPRMMKCNSIGFK